VGSRRSPYPRSSGSAEASERLAAFRAFERVALALVFILLAVLTIRQVGSLDIGFHLKAGAHMLAGRGWPRTDPFTFTLGDHPYIDTTWGYQILATLVHRLAGFTGLIFVHGALILALFWIVYRTARLRAADSVALPLALLLGVLASEIRFEARPELVSWVFLALILHILHRRAEGLRSPVWLIAPIHLLWANTHALFVLGWLAEACFLAGIFLRERRIDRTLLLWIAAGVAVTMINPYGWKGLTFPFTLATRMQGQNLFAQSIGEFASPFALRLSATYPFYPRIPILAYRLLAVLSLVSLVVAWKDRRFWSLLLWGGFLFLSVRMIRNIPLLAIAVIPMTAWGLPIAALARRLRSGAKLARWLPRAVLACVSLAAVLLTLRVINDGYYSGSRRLQRFGLGVSPISLPVEASGFAREMELRGPVLNHLNFGGWLMWAHPDPVFIDGRLEVVGERFFDYYHRVLASSEMLEECVGRYGIRWIIFPYAMNPDLLQRLSRDSRWSLVWVDRLAVIFVRRGSAPRAEATPLRAFRKAAGPSPRALPGLGGPARLGPLRRWLRGLWSSQAFPDEDYNLGIFHLYRGEPSLAAPRFAAAIARTGGAYYEMYNNLAIALFDLGRYEEARACYEIVLTDAPGMRAARERIALIDRLRYGGSP